MDWTDILDDEGGFSVREKLNNAFQELYANNAEGTDAQYRVFDGVSGRFEDQGAMIGQQADADIDIPENGQIQFDNKANFYDVSDSGVINALSIIDDSKYINNDNKRTLTEDFVEGKLTGGTHIHLAVKANTQIIHNATILPLDDFPNTASQFRPIRTESGKDEVYVRDTVISFIFNKKGFWQMSSSVTSADDTTVTITYQVVVVAGQSARVILVGGSSTVNWGEGATESFQSGVEKTHIYTTSGTFTVTLKCADSTTLLDISNSNAVGSLNNIESLLKLKTLYFHDNQINNANVGTLIQLTQLYCYNNILTVLATDNLTLITDLRCYSNAIMNLNTINLSLIIELRVYENNISLLDISNMELLLRLYCGNNNISELDFTNKPNIQILSCENNNLAGNLGIASLTTLLQVECSGNSLTNVEIEFLTSLTSLRCHSNNITGTLAVDNLLLLTNLRCYNNNIIVLNTLNLVNLTELLCFENDILLLPVQLLIALHTLVCNNNAISDIASTNLELMKNLNVEQNQLSALDISNMTVLEELYCNNNSIDLLFFNSPVLHTVDFYSNSMTTIASDNSWNALDASTNATFGNADGGNQNQPVSNNSLASRNNLINVKFWNIAA